MIVNAARQLGVLAAAGKRSCFVGIGLPSTAANLARRLYDDRAGADLRVGLHRFQAHAAAAVDRRRRAGGDQRRGGQRARDLRLLVAGGRIDIGFLSGAQLDKYANINSTVIGSYEHPEDPPARCRRRTGDRRIGGSGDGDHATVDAGFVERCDFRTSIGFGDGKGDRERFGLRGGGPKWVITDLAVMEPDPDTCELVVVALHPGVTREQVVAATGWAVRSPRKWPRPPCRPTASSKRCASAAGGMKPFTYDQLPARVVFGAGRLCGRRRRGRAAWRSARDADLRLGRRAPAAAVDRASSGLGSRWPGTRSPNTCPSSSPTGPAQRQPRRQSTASFASAEARRPGLPRRWR